MKQPEFKINRGVKYLDCD